MLGGTDKFKIYTYLLMFSYLSKQDYLNTNTHLLVHHEMIVIIPPSHPCMYSNGWVHESPLENWFKGGLYLVSRFPNLFKSYALSACEH